ncbi:MAG: DUF3656 domain-containing protein [Fibrobacteres bacterium]|nr:DUF3656 domain-containing protein [Fibrobacterota bacterium]
MLRTIPELLAPAGSPEALMAGLDAGADAFYCGAPDFNARKRAKNFTRDDIEGATALLHSKGKKLYITLNTLIYDHELPAAIELLIFLNRIKVDAVIVQDLGIMSLISENFPDLTIHASTQAFAHNRLQCEFLRNLGVRRIVLPREMSLVEIEEIQRLVPLEYEIFIHGAMCFSFSGACLFSSYEFGASGNRGECRQACRHAFAKNKDTASEEFYPFSMKDLNSAPILDKLLSLNPASLKIEGRLKNSDYVFKTVSHYRKLLDTYKSGGTASSSELLKGQRISSTGYFTDSSYSRIVASEAPGITGEVIGQAEIHKRDEITLNLSKTLQKGSRIRISDDKGRVIHDGTLLNFNTRQSGSKVTIHWYSAGVTPTKGRYTALLLGSTNPQDPTRAFKHALTERKLDSVTLSLKWKSGQLITEASVKGKTFLKDHSSDFPLEDARSGDRDALTLKLATIFAETAAHTFSVNSVRIDIPESKFAPPSSIKAIRREIFDAVEEKLKSLRQSSESVLMEKLYGIYEKKLTDCAITDGETLQQCKIEELTLEKEADALSDSDVYLLLPVFVADSRLPLWEKKIKSLISSGYSRFIASSYGWLSFLKQQNKTIKAVSGPYVYCVNRFTLSLLRLYGADAFIISPDIKNGEIAPLNRSKFAKIIPGIPKEYFITRLRLPEKEYFYKGKSFNVTNHDEYDTLNLN